MIDLSGTILGAFELPVTGRAVTWLSDGRRVLMTESSEWFPALWDGAALLTLPLPDGFGRIMVSCEQWTTSEGLRRAGVAYALKVATGTNHPPPHPGSYPVPNPPSPPPQTLPQKLPQTLPPRQCPSHTLTPLPAFTPLPPPITAGRAARRPSNRRAR